MTVSGVERGDPHRLFLRDSKTEPMRSVIQRVLQAEVTVDGEVVGRIDRGLLVLLGVHQDDTESDADFLATKCVELRIFADDQDKMNRSLLDAGGAMLVVSQFTLWGDCRKGRRPSFVDAAPPDRAEQLYEHFCRSVTRQGVRVAQGRFRTSMQVSLINDGPVTLVLESPRHRT
jgi:D-tyrosyl-tRNA(Tyr) deacylase